MKIEQKKQADTGHSDKTRYNEGSGRTEQAE